ncbi:hypothetical protein LV779_02680 [Streptomyces thinghirensis]|nr:hypothetical protein [Streptomyces thinghirensis]
MLWRCPGSPPHTYAAPTPQLRKSRVRPLTAVDADDTWSTEIGEHDDAHVERAAIEYTLTPGPSPTTAWD